MEKLILNEYFLNSDDIIFNYFRTAPIYNFPYPWSKPKIRFSKLSDITKTLYHKTELPDIRSNDYKKNLMRKYSLSFSCSDLYYQKERIMKIKNKYNHVFKQANKIISEGPILKDDKKYEEELYIKQLSNNIITYSEKHFRESNCYGVMTLEQYLHGIRCNMNRIIVKLNKLRKGT